MTIVDLMQNNFLPDFELEEEDEKTEDENVLSVMELSENEKLYVKGTEFVLIKKKRKTRLAFDNFTYISLLRSMRYLLPFILNPTPRQYELILTFQKEVPSHSLEESDFVYPCMTPKMIAVMKIACEASDFCRTETFIQKHFLGLNLPTLNVLCKVAKITGPL